MLLMSLKGFPAWFPCRKRAGGEASQPLVRNADGLRTKLGASFATGCQSEGLILGASPRRAQLRLLPNPEKGAFGFSWVGVSAGRWQRPPSFLESLQSQQFSSVARDVWARSKANEE